MKLNKYNNVFLQCKSNSGWMFNQDNYIYFLFFFILCFFGFLTNSVTSSAGVKEAKRFSPTLTLIKSKFPLLLVKAEFQTSDEPLKEIVCTLRNGINIEHRVHKEAIMDPRYPMNFYHFHKQDNVWTALLSPQSHLNYYFDFHVCACFCLSFFVHTAD